ncbi:hypothetical protein KP509_13G002100 [Ceratopteris richardii]|uniref:Uncharacterized protein n=1 Tax=Ceratopteris richardii TaxID=49495 RepID=A0A8T2TG47_CERRI|nr:hypothetical protein KP509_13G002100 [Ceratopteris richardii]
MYTPRERTGLGYHHSTTPCYSSSTRSYSACRTPSPSICRTACSHLCDWSTSIHSSARKAVRFDRQDAHLGRSKSVNRVRFHGTFRDSDSTYRPTSPTLFSRPKSALDDAKVLEYANLNVLLRRLSVLQLEMKGLLSGRSLKERVQMIGQKLDDAVHVPSSKSNSRSDCLKPPAEKKPSTIQSSYHSQQAAQSSQPCVHQVNAHHIEKHRWQSPIVQRKEREEQSLVCRKQEISPRRRLMEELEHNTKEECKDNQGPCEITVHDDPEWKEKKKIIQLWRDYNCDLHLRRIIDGSRKEAACRIIERVIHAQLTYYMLQYIGAVAKGLMGDDKTHYLGFFKKEGPFRNKPLNEGTYCELLGFVDKQPHPAKDVIKALEVSEEGLEEEGGRGGYDPHAMGDIRAQMRVFMSISSNLSASSANCVSVSQADEDKSIFTRDLLQDLTKAADEGKLGALQQAHGLVKLACFLALKRVESFF